MPETEEIVEAWNSVTDRWIVRRSLDKSCIEVVHNWGGDVIDDEMMKVIARYDKYETANSYADREEQMARARAVKCLYES